MAWGDDAVPYLVATKPREVVKRKREEALRGCSGYSQEWNAFKKSLRFC